jgi:PKD repeat protein
MVLLLFVQGLHAQCPQVFDFYGLPSANPYWYTCSGTNYTLNLQSPNNWGPYTVDWGDGTPDSNGANWNSPTIVSHPYTATVDTFIVTITQVNTGCVVQGVLVMEEATSASIQIPVGGLTQACAPQVLEFINSSTNVSETTVFTWDFGDGSPPITFDYTNLGQTISHLYQPNTVDCETEVSLLAENYCNTIQGGASEATFNPIRIWDVDEAAITPSATVLCFPDNTVTFTNTTERNCLFQGNIAQRYEYWNFGDYWGEGQDSIIDWTPWPPTFPHTLSYPGIGNYEVMMLDSNFCGIDTATIVISIIPPPTAGLSVSADTVCVGSPITFFNQSSGGGDLFQWNFGDGIGWLPTGGGNITYVYNNPGTYLVQTMVSVQSSGGSCADTASVPVTVLPAPNAIISADNYDGCDQITVNFTDNSTQGPVDWQWNFGNGNIYSGNTPPPQDYNNPGTYIISLSVENSFGCSDTDQETVQVFESPDVDFIAENVCQGSNAQFTDLSTFDPGDPIISWNWNFGDGQSSTDSDPIHTYAGTGVFFVTLSVQTPQCNGTATIPITVEPAPIPAFTLDPSIGCSPLGVAFTNNTFGAASYEWSFGDGNFTAEENPTHTFLNFGNTDTTYTVILTAFTAFGCGRSDSLNVTVQPGSLAAFTDNSNPPGCSPFAAEFVNESQGAVSYLWDFGDGTTSTATNPAHLYNNTTGFLQTYNVELIAYAANGCNDTTYSSVIVYPLADFDFDVFPVSGCSPLTVNFPFISGIQTYQWSFGDGEFSNSPVPVHIYENNTPGTQVFDIQLIGTSPFGCIDTSYSSVSVDPQPTAQFTADIIAGCSPITVTFENLSLLATNFEWNYDDGSTSTTSDIIHTHTFTNQSGQTQVYDVSLTAMSPDGCEHTFTIAIAVYPEITAAFEPPAPVCSPATIQLLNTSQGGNSYLWDLGNGIVSTNTFPTTTYSNTGITDTTYIITLEIVSLNGCTAQTTGSILVHPVPVGGFNLSETTGCQPLPVEITNTSSLADSYLWLYGDGTQSATAAPVHEHEFTSFSPNPAVFDLTLIAYNSFGCADTIIQPVTVYPQVTSGILGGGEGCSPLGLNFISTSSGATASLSWNFGDGALASGPVINHQFINNSGNDTTYTVTLIAENIFGCIDSSEVTVDIYATPLADIEILSEEGCYPLEVTFQNNSIGADTYEWLYGTGETSTNADPEHTVLFYNNTTNPVTYSITLVANSDGCVDSDQVQVTVYPALNAEFSNPDDGCSPLTIAFDNLSVGAASYEWDFGDGNTHTISEPTHTFTNNTTEDITYTITLTATSPFGCTDTFTQEVTVFATPDAAFSATPQTQIFPDATVNITNNSTGGASLIYNWNFGNSETSSEQDPGSYTYDTWGTYEITLFITNSSCSDFTTQIIEIIPPEPIANFIFEGSGCAPLTVTFENYSLFGDSYFWQFGDGGTSTVESPVYTYETGGTYTVTLTVTGFDGSISVYQSVVEVLPAATAAFTVSPSEVSVPSQPVQMINLSQDAVGYIWDFGDGTTSTETNPEHYYSEGGLYTIILIALNEFGCPDTFVVVDAVYAIEDGNIEFPNAFTPSDGGPFGGEYEPDQLNNDIFFPVQSGVEEYQLQLFNKWGELLFESDHVGIGWDGYYRGELCKQDVYAWKAKVRFSSGRELVLTGDVTLLR